MVEESLLGNTLSSTAREYERASRAVKPGQRAGCKKPCAAGEAESEGNVCLSGGPAERLPGGLRTKREGLTKARNCARKGMDGAGLGAEGAR